MGGRFPCMSVVPSTVMCTRLGGVVWAVTTRLVLAKIASVSENAVWQERNQLLKWRGRARAGPERFLLMLLVGENFCRRSFINPYLMNLPKVRLNKTDFVPILEIDPSALNNEERRAG